MRGGVNQLAVDMTTKIGAVVLALILIIVLAVSYVQSPDYEVGDKFVFELTGEDNAGRQIEGIWTFEITAETTDRWDVSSDLEYVIKETGQADISKTLGFPSGNPLKSDGPLYFLLEDAETDGNSKIDTEWGSRTLDKWVEDDGGDEIVYFADSKHRIFKVTFEVFSLEGSDFEAELVLVDRP